MIKNNLNRRSFIRGSTALTAAGWLGGASTWVLRPEWSHAAGPIKMGIATDITGAIAFAGNPNWQTAQLAVRIFP